MELKYLLCMLVCVPVVICQQCPTGWAQYGSSCFIPKSDVKNWYEAQQSCQQEGGDLARAKTANTNTFLANLILDTGSSHWIGLHDLSLEGDFEWTDGTLLDPNQSPWNPGEPNNIGEEDCVEVYIDGSWNDFPCTNIKPYVCERLISTAIKCDEGSGWTSADGKCYKYYDSDKTWTDANNYCKAIGSDLISVQSAAEQEVVTTNSQYNGQTIWIGATDIKRSERWTTTEVVTLIHHVKAKGPELFGTGGGHGVEGRKRKMWTGIAEEVAAVGASRGWEGARKKWQDLTHRAKVYLKNRIGANVTGGGPQPPANEIFEAVLDVLPSAVTHGIAPFGQCETVPKSPVQIVKEIIPISPDTPGTSVQGPPHPSTSTETESSQDHDQSQETEPARKRKRSQKSQKSTKGKRRKQDKDKKSKDVTLLELNMKMVELEEKKMIYKEEKIKLQRELIDVLKSINNNIEKMNPSTVPIDFSLLTSMQTEQ